MDLESTDRLSQRQPILDYDKDIDDEVFVSSEIKIGTMTLHAEGATVAGSLDKPNEDSFAGFSDDEHTVVAVFDGASSLEPILSLRESGARYASRLLKEQLGDTNSTDSPAEIALFLNKELFDTYDNLDISLENIHALPAAVATILEINKSTVNFAHIGDTFGIAYYKDGRSSIFTENKYSMFEKHIFSLMKELALKDGISHREVRNDPRIQESIIKRRMDSHNNPNGEGIGVINGDPEMENYILSGKIPTSEISAILIASDGLLPPGWSLDDRNDRQRILETITLGGFRRMFELKRKAENDDPDWNHVRFKHSDDATGVLISFT